MKLAGNAAQRLRDEEFTAFVTGSSPRLLHIARLVTGDPHRAEDLVQGALLGTYRKWDAIRHDDPFAYARRSVVNGHVSWWRLSARRELLTEQLPDRPTQAVPFHHTVDQRDLLRAALADLTRRERTVIVLRYIEDLSERQIADELDIAAGTVKSTASRALTKLRSHGALLEDSGERR